LTRVITSSRKAPDGRRRVLVMALVLLAALVVLAPGAGTAGAGTTIKRGTYSGKTSQDAVGSSFRQVQFTVSKGKVTLTTEPTVARQYCLSTPVFTVDGTSSKKLGRDRTFTLTHTFFGNKIDKIHGAFVSSNEIDGYVIYHFQAQDLCSEGKTKVSFSAKHK
jgi:major membrane immunogen (membrane-anchored lipoprotein)